MDEKKGEQIAALPMRWDENGKLEILMVTSRGTGVGLCQGVGNGQYQAMESRVNRGA